MAVNVAEGYTHWVFRIFQASIFSFPSKKKKKAKLKHDHSLSVSTVGYVVFLCFLKPQIMFTFLSADTEQDEADGRQL